MCLNFNCRLLEQERAKLGRLRGLLATVQEYRSSGLPIPENILNEFGNEVQPSTLGSTSPSRTSGSQRGAQEEDAAAEADVEEDDEPESSIQWNQEQLSLVERCVSKCLLQFSFVFENFT